jgi:hypothetical protein
MCSAAPYSTIHHTKPYICAILHIAVRHTLGYGIQYRKSYYRLWLRYTASCSSLCARLLHTVPYIILYGMTVLNCMANCSMRMASPYSTVYHTKPYIYDIRLSTVRHTLGYGIQYLISFYRYGYAVPHWTVRNTLGCSIQYRTSYYMVWLCYTLPCSSLCARLHRDNTV